MKDLSYYTNPIFPNDWLDIGCLNKKTAFSEQKLSSIQRKSLKPAVELSFPAAKSDAWRWTAFSRLDANSLRPGKNNLSRVNFSEAQPGITLMSLNQAWEEKREVLSRYFGKVVPGQTDKFSALASVYGSDGFLFHVKPGVVAEKMVEIEFSGALDGVNLGHSLIVLEDETSVTLVLHNSRNAKGPSFDIRNLEVSLGKNAHLQLIEINDQAMRIAAVSHEKVQLASGADLTWIYAQLGEGISKHFIDIDLKGEHASAFVRGFYFSASGQNMDLDTQVNHLAPNASSDLLFKGAANGRGVATWEGMIYVDPVAMKTDAYQANRNLALSPDAEIHSIPGLEICADDVKCSHGATVGHLDDEELYYLQNRGISLQDAETLLVNGFFAEIIDAIPDEALRKVLTKRINQKLITA